MKVQKTKMKRYKDLYEKIITYENIEKAYIKAKKGKSNYSQVQMIEKNVSFYLKEIQAIFISETFKTSKYKIKKIYEPKEREIYVLPFYPDRIIQHAVMNIVSPIWDKIFIYDSYACRPGKGQHKASQRLMYFIRKSKYNFYFQGDIKKFYPSIDHTIMYDIITKKIKDKKVLAVFKDIIDSISGDKNVPIGNLTSQWLGNLYLNELDTFIKHELKIKYYLRYNDDFVLFGKTTKELKILEEKIRLFLKENLNLILCKEKIQSVKNGIDFIGYRHFPDKILLRKSSAKRIKKNLNNKTYSFYKKTITEQQFISTLNSIKGWLAWANTFNLQKKLKIECLLKEAQDEKFSKVY